MRLSKMDFVILGINAKELLEKYFDDIEFLSSNNQQMNHIADFLFWINSEMGAVFTQSAIDKYIGIIYSSHKFSYSEVICSHVRQFCKWLFDNEYTVMFSFSSKPKKDTADKKESGEYKKSDKLRKITDYYRALSLTPDASSYDIKHAYKKLTLEIHPDLNDNDSKASSRMIALNKIIDTLKNPDKRLSYDITFGYKERPNNYELPEIKSKKYYAVWM